MTHAFIIFRETGELVATSPQVHAVTGYGDELASLDDWILHLFPSAQEMAQVSEFIRTSSANPTVCHPPLPTRYVTRSGHRHSTLLTTTSWREAAGERRVLIGLHPIHEARHENLHLSSATWSGLIAQVEELIEESLTTLQAPDEPQAGPHSLKERWAAVAQKLARGRHLIAGARRLEQTLGSLDQEAPKSSASTLSPSR